MSRNALEIYNIVCVLDGLGIYVIFVNSAKHQIHMNTLLVYNAGTFLAHDEGMLLHHNGCRLLRHNGCKLLRRFTFEH